MSTDNTDRDKIAQQEMLPFSLCGLAAMVAKKDMTNIPGDLKKCQTDLRKTKHLLASALGSHLVCHVRLQIAVESSRKVGMTAQDNQLDSILKECRE
jgi:hypothetical protein